MKHEVDCPTCNGTNKNPKNRKDGCKASFCRGGRVYTDGMCDCECHDPGSQIMHIMACCGYCGWSRDEFAEVLKAAGAERTEPDPPPPIVKFKSVTMPKIRVKRSLTAAEIVSVQPMTATVGGGIFTLDYSYGGDKTVVEVTAPRVETEAERAERDRRHFGRPRKGKPCPKCESENTEESRFPPILDAVHCQCLNCKNSWRRGTRRRSQ